MSTKAELELEERKEGKDLYSYQKGAIDKIFTAFEESRHWLCRPCHSR